MQQDKQFHGAVIKRWRVNNFAFSESVFPPGARIQRHEHALPYFSILLRGSYRETYSRGVRECKPATAVLHPAGEWHADDFFNAGGRIFRFEINATDPVFSPWRSGWDMAELRCGKVRCLAARLYRENCRQDRFSPLAAEALAMEILSHATRQSFPRETGCAPAWLRRAVELLREALPENLTVRQIALAVGVHPIHLTRVFRRQFGCTVGEYARNWRMDLVSRRLAASVEPIAGIAAIAGFADQAHLCRTFKSFGGMAPRDYRKVFSEC